MARQKQASVDPDQVRQLAEKLFVAHWPGPKAQYDASHTVETCFAAAETFVRHAATCNRPSRNTEAEPETTTDTGS